MRVTIHDDDRLVLEYTPPVSDGQVPPQNLCPSRADQSECLDALVSAVSFLKISSCTDRQSDRCEPALESA